MLSAWAKIRVTRNLRVAVAASDMSRPCLWDLLRTCQLTPCTIFNTRKHHPTVFPPPPKETPLCYRQRPSELFKAWSTVDSKPHRQGATPGGGRSDVLLAAPSNLWIFSFFNLSGISTGRSWGRDSQSASTFRRPTRWWPTTFGIPRASSAPIQLITGDGELSLAAIANATVEPERIKTANGLSRTEWPAGWPRLQWPPVTRTGPIRRLPLAAVFLKLPRARSGSSASPRVSALLRYPHPFNRGGDPYM